MPLVRSPLPVCEYDKAYRELVSAPPSSPPPARSPCSPEPPEARAYPPPPSGGPEYVLCNGHLSDLFDARDRATRPTPHAAPR